MFVHLFPFEESVLRVLHGQLPATLGGLPRAVKRASIAPEGGNATSLQSLPQAQAPGFSRVENVRPCALQCRTAGFLTGEGRPRAARRQARASEARRREHGGGPLPPIREPRVLQSWRVSLEARMCRMALCIPLFFEALSKVPASPSPWLFCTL